MSFAADSSILLKPEKTTLPTTSIQPPETLIIPDPVAGTSVENVVAVFISRIQGEPRDTVAPFKVRYTGASRVSSRGMVEVKDEAKFR